VHGGVHAVQDHAADRMGLPAHPLAPGEDVAVGRGAEQAGRHVGQRLVGLEGKRCQGVGVQEPGLGFPLDDPRLPRQDGHQRAAGGRAHAQRLGRGGQVRGGLVGQRGEVVAVNAVRPRQGHEELVEAGGDLDVLRVQRQGRDHLRRGRVEHGQLPHGGAGQEQVAAAPAAHHVGNGAGQHHHLAAGVGPQRVGRLRGRLGRLRRQRQLGNLRGRFGGLRGRLRGRPGGRFGLFGRRRRAVGVRGRIRGDRSRRLGVVRNRLADDLAVGPRHRPGADEPPHAQRPSAGQGKGKTEDEDGARPPGAPRLPTRPETGLGRVAAWVGGGFDGRARRSEACPPSGALPLGGPRRCLRVRGAVAGLFPGRRPTRGRLAPGAASAGRGRTGGSGRRCGCSPVPTAAGFGG
jgi:hypothetical protein